MPIENDLKLETLIAEYVDDSNRDFIKQDLKNIRIADIIAAVESENCTSKCTKRNKRKAPQPKSTTKKSLNSAQPPRKRTKLWFVYFGYVYILFIPLKYNKIFINFSNESQTLPPELVQ